MKRQTPELLLALLVALPVAAQDAPVPVPAAPPADAPAVADEEPAAVSLEGLTTAELVQKLDAPEYAIREDATRRLLMDDSLDQLKLLELLKTAGSPEQRNRLLVVAEHHFVRTMREEIESQIPDEGILPTNRRGAGIGFSHSPLPPKYNPFGNAAAVIVDSTMPGFPGYVHLRPGDLILAINDSKTFSTLEASIRVWVGNVVSAQPPGATLTLTVARDGEVMDIKIKAASSFALSEMYTTDKRASFLQGHYQRRWLEAREALIADLPEPQPLAPAQER